MKITSAGIIRNEDKPRVGVIGLSSLNDFMYDLLDSGIDLTYEEWRDETEQAIRNELSETLSGDELDNEVERRMERENDGYETDSRVILIGDWTQNETGQYMPDTAGEYAATYNSGTGNICVEWSKFVTKCHHTSPCYVMADGSGPCGDLDTPGDSVLAYTLPPDCFRNERE